MGSTSFLGFSCPNLLLVFLNLFCIGTCCIFFRKCWDFLWSFLFYLSVLYFRLACDHGNSFLALESKKDKVLDRGQNRFQCEDNNSNQL